MNAKSKVGCLAAIVSCFVVYPIWYALLFQILVRVDAVPWMWSAYWCYIPAGILSGIISCWVITSAGEP